MTRRRAAVLEPSTSTYRLVLNVVERDAQGREVIVGEWDDLAPALADAGAALTLAQAVRARVQREGR